MLWDEKVTTGTGYVAYGGVLLHRPQKVAGAIVQGSFDIIFTCHLFAYL